jgi:hypothetical protein
MRPSLLGLLATTTIVSAIDTRCVNNDFEELVIRISCGDSESISKCIREYVNTFSLEEISPCFVVGGCKKDDAVWFMQECTMPDLRQDLKKRATTDDSNDSSTTNAKTTAQTTAKASATKAASTTAPSSTQASTTATSTTASTAASSTASSIIPDSSTSSTSATTSSVGYWGPQLFPIPACFRSLQTYFWRHFP